jgi:hypothetical protein
MEISRFAVGERPRCIWGKDLFKRNRSFIESLDPNLFRCQADTLLGKQIDEITQYEAVSLRLYFGMGVELLLSYIGALIQAPDCVFGWLNLYKERDIEYVINCIKQESPILNKIEKDKIGWQDLSEYVHEYFYLEDGVLRNKIVRRFGELWGRIADDFLDPISKSEFNSIKHGARIGLGGFGLSMGRSGKSGTPCPPAKMHPGGRGKYGTSFYTLEKLQNSPLNLFISHHSRNWDPISYACGLNLISMSLFNILVRLKIANQSDRDRFQYFYPQSDEDFDSPWMQGVPARSISFKFGVDCPPEALLGKNEILAVYRKAVE